MYKNQMNGYKNHGLNKVGVGCMLKRTFILVLFVLCLAQTGFAAGTTAGDSVIARASSLNATYDDGISGLTQALDKTELSDASTQVLTVFGLLFLSSGTSGISDIDQAVTGGVGTLLTRRMVVQNHANTLDANLSYATGNYVLHKAAGDMSTEEEWLAATQLWWSATSLGEDADALVTVGVTVPAGVVNGTSWNILVSANTSSTPVRKYQGFNTTEYGGYESITKSATFEVYGSPYLEVVTRTVEVVAPTAGMQYTGGANDAVPGARLKYTIVIQNTAPTSSTAAKDIVFNDHVPVHTSYYAAAPMSFTADDGVTFATSNVSGTLVWAQDNSAVKALLVGSRVTLNFTVTID